jgi:radical SAM superfamily enzyme YgiQ (UPF0313 family)
VIPPGITYLKAVLQSQGQHEADIIDLRMLSGFEEYRQKLLEGKYHVVGISCLSPSRDYAVAAGRIARELGLITLAGGVHASALPDDFAATGFFDCVVAGEAERSFLHILTMVEQRTELPSIFKTENYVVNLDELPFPATAYLPTYKHAFDVNGGMAGISGSRGCPGRCKYCWPNQRIMYGAMGIRRRSPQNIVDEILYLQENFRINLVTFYDDTFSWNKPWLRNFRQHVNAVRRTGRQLPALAVNARANMFDEEIAEILKDVGCIGVWFGFESGSPKILKLLNKGCTLEQNIRAATICREAGFDVNANMLVGIPGESLEDYILSYRFLDAIQPDNVRYNILSPYPGSAFYDELSRSGLIDMKSWENLDVASPYRNGKGVIRNVDYRLVMRWVEPFRSFAAVTQLMRTHPSLSKSRVFHWLLKLLRTLGRSPRLVGLNSGLIHLATAIYSSLKRFSRS